MISGKRAGAAEVVANPYLRTVNGVTASNSNIALRRGSISL
jgi:hypothetical protein